MHHQIATGAVIAQTTGSKTLERHGILRLAAGRNLQRPGAIESVDVDIMAEHRPDHRHAHPAMQIIAVTGELFVGLDVDVHIQITCGATMAQLLDPEAEGRSDQIEDYIIETPIPGVQLIPSSIELIRADIASVYTGRGADNDIVVSSAKAYVNAINRMIQTTRSKEGK